VSSLWSIWPLPQHADTILGILLLKADYPALIFFVAGYSVLYIQQIRTHTHLEATLRELALAHAKLETAHAQLLASAEEIEALTLITERQRMARELHDTLAQGLAGVLMQIQAANSHLTHLRYNLAQEIMQQTLSSARQTLMAARSAIDDLRSAASGSGDRAETIQEEIDRFSAATGITCHASGLALLSNVPAAPGEHIGRGISEGLLNVARHAQAQHVWVRVTKSDQNIEIELEDDGIGFEPAIVAAQTGHYGLLGLRERARLVGGQLEIISTPGNGTMLRLRIPGNQEETPHE
jgi:NarL family two-component system sensor histidine kinase YdfH